MEERYRNMLEEVHAPARLRTEVMNMAEQKNRKHMPLRPLLIAAVVIAALMGTVLAATSGFDFVKIYSSGEKTHMGWDGEEWYELYEVTPNGVACVPVEDLPQEVLDAVVRGGSRPLTYLRLEDWNAAEEFLKVGLVGSTVLEESGEQVRFAVGGGINVVGCEVDIYSGLDIYCGLKLCCGEEPPDFDPYMIGVHEMYRLGEEAVSLDVVFPTDAIYAYDAVVEDFSIEDFLSHGFGSNDSSDTASAEEYLTANGLETVIITHTGSSDVRTVERTFTWNGLHYKLWVYGTDSEHGVQTMKEVLDGFQV